MLFLDLGWSKLRYGGATIRYEIIMTLPHLIILPWKDRRFKIALVSYFHHSIFLTRRLAELFQSRNGEPIAKLCTFNHISNRYEIYTSI